MSHRPDTPPEILETSAAIYRERNASYGENWLNVGPALHALLPEGILLSTPEDQTRYHIFSLMMVKMSRYATNFNKGGHKDSLSDLAVYSAMLQHLDEKIELER